jgi:hypothetical protein
MKHGLKSHALAAVVVVAAVDLVGAVDEEPAAVGSAIAGK